MIKPKLSKPSDYLDNLHKTYAGTPLEIAGKTLQNHAYFPHLGWAAFANDFEIALQAYRDAGGK